MFLTRMAEELLEKETIVLDDIERILAELRPGQYEPVIQGTKVGKSFVDGQKAKGADAPVTLATSNKGSVEERPASSTAETGQKESAGDGSGLQSPGAIAGKD